MTDLVFDPPTFATGQRVRVRLSAECPREPIEGSLPYDLGIRRGHLPAEDGATGAVLWWSANDDEHDGHGWWVVLDRIDLGDGDSCRRSLRYAWIELEPLDEQDEAIPDR